MSEDNVIPFRKRQRPPTERELEVYRQATRNWTPQMRQLMFPHYFEHDQNHSDE